MKKGLILALLISLAVLMSACTIDLPTAKIKNCCISIDIYGNALECTNMISKYQSNCTAMYPSSNTQFKNVECSLLSACNGIITNEQQGCCVVKDNADITTLGCYFMLQGSQNDCVDTFSYYGEVLFSPTSCDIPPCEGVTSCMGIFSEDGIDYTYLIENDQYKCGPVGTSTADKSYKCTNSQLVLDEYCVSDCDQVTGKCGTGSTDFCTYPENDFQLCDISAIGDQSGICLDGVCTLSDCTGKSFGTSCYNIENSDYGYCIDESCQVCIPPLYWNNKKLCKLDFPSDNPCDSDPYLPECDSYEHLNFCKTRLMNEMCGTECGVARPYGSFCIHTPDDYIDHYYFGGCSYGNCISGI